MTSAQIAESHAHYAIKYSWQKFCWKNISKSFFRLKHITRFKHNSHVCLNRLDMTNISKFSLKFFISDKMPFVEPDCFPSFLHFILTIINFITWNCLNWKRFFIDSSNLAIQLGLSISIWKKSDLSMDENPLKLALLNRNSKVLCKLVAHVKPLQLRILFEFSSQ